MASSESFGFGLRVLARGTWGFSASQQVTREAIARSAREAADIARANASLRRKPAGAGQVPPGRVPHGHRPDPFTVPISDKLGLLQQANEEMKKVKGVFSASGVIAQRAERRFFASSEGSLLEQHIHQIAPEITATAVDKGRKTKTRTYRPHAVCAGYEAATRARLSAEARRVGEEAVNRLRAPSVRAGKRDLVLLPTHLGLTIHESIGHSTELDRALGWEANFAGTSFLTTDKLGKFRVGADHIHFRGDRTRPKPVHLRLGRRRRGHGRVPHHRQGDLRRYRPPGPGPPGGRCRLHRLLLRPQLARRALPAHAEREPGS